MGFPQRDFFGGGRHKTGAGAALFMLRLWAYFDSGTQSRLHQAVWAKPLGGISW